MSPKQIIARCVEEFEAKTQVELVVLVKRSSASYFDFFWFYTLFLVQTFWVVTVMLDDSFVFLSLVIESFLIIGLSYLFLMRLELLKYLVPAKFKNRKLRELAAREFFDLGIFNTRRRSGLLIVYSHFENMCVLFCDKGVKEKISEKEIADYTEQFRSAFNGKNLSESVGSMIRTFGVYWRNQWPNEDDENEIVHAVSGELE
ncbi:MAG: hypothetical protein JNL11_04750 [Bdellovibrionaceae bacterium]|nr:hypothetical protein [Pseudobdellovibrionaceae bacterium]